jgi:hypothetical protein
MKMTSHLPKAIAMPSVSVRSVVSIWSVLVLAAFLRFFQIGAEGVWLDELYSIDDAINLTSGNLDLRPLYYVLLRGWMILGGSDAVLRSLSAVLDLGAIYLGFRLCLMTLGRSVALVAALMMSLSPLVINHAQEIRMYPLITFLTLGGSLLMARVLEKPTLLNIGFWAFARLLAIFTSPLMLLMLFPDCVLFGLAYWRKWPQLRKFSYGLIFLGVAWSPLVLPKLFNTVPSYIETQGNPYRVGITNLLSRLTQFTVFWPLNAITDVDRSLVPLSFYKLFTLVLVAVLIFGLAAIRFNMKSRPLWIAAWGFLPLLAQYVANETVMEGTIWKPRYLLYISPYFFMLLALGFDRLCKWKPPIAIATAILYLIATFGGLQFYYVKDFRPPWNDIAAVIEAQEKPGDIIVNYTWMGNHNMPRYYEGSSNMVTLHLPRRQTEAERLEMVQSAIKTLPQSQRLWLVCQAGCKEQEEYTLITEAALGENSSELFSEEFSNVVDEGAGLDGIELHVLTRENT